MSVSAPHFLLYAEAAQAAACSDSEATGWRFVLRQPGGETELEADDEEPATSVERLELLAVVRGLEALAQPSRVTLVAGSRYLRRGLESGLAYWKENDWQWERYGRMTPIKNKDLWRRLDRLTDIHRLDFPPARIEGVDDLAAPPPPRRTIAGRNIRIDSVNNSGPNHAARNPQSAISSKDQGRGWGLADLVPAARYVCRIFAAIPLFNLFLSSRSRGEDNCAHYRVAGRHARSARRSTGSPRRRARAADGSTRRT